MDNQHSGKYLTSTWALPKPSPTGMGFRDLRWDFVKDQVCCSFLSAVSIKGKVVLVLAIEKSSPISYFKPSSFRIYTSML